MTNNISKQFLVTTEHDQVTGSCSKLSYTLSNGSTYNILIDCGLFLEKEYETRNHSFSFSPNSIDAVILTHAHLDHCGRIPLLYQQGYQNKVYTTKASCELVAISLNSFFKTNHPTSKYLKTHQSCSYQNLYREEDVLQALNSMVSCKYNTFIQLNENVSFMLLENGHILGASCVYIRIHDENGEECNFLFSGDYAKENFFFPVKDFPKTVTQSPVHLFIESTYGDTSTKDIKYILDDLLIQSTKEKKIILICTYALDRQAKIAGKIMCLQKENALNPSYPVYLDGISAYDFNKVYYDYHDTFYKEKKYFFPRHTTFIYTVKKREHVLSRLKPCIIATPAGEGSLGPAIVYLRALISNPNAVIIFPSYLSETSLGYQLVHMNKGETLTLYNGQKFQLNAQVIQTSESSCHARNDDLIRFIQKFRKINSIGINHGQGDTKEYFRTLCEKMRLSKMVYTMHSDTVYRFNQYQLIKSFPRQKKTS